jgi:hypothetical protein
MAFMVISNLLKAELVRAGFPTGDGVDFEPWQLTAEQALERVEREWDALGRELDIGEIFWFEIAEKGRERLADR